MIRFIDIRDQGTGYRFCFWDTVHDCHVKVYSEECWNSWKDFEQCLLIVYPKITLNRFRGLCPDWVFNDEEDALEDWIAGDIVSPYEKIEELETKIESIKRDHALEQLDRNMAKDREQ